MKNLIIDALYTGAVLVMFIVPLAVVGTIEYQERYDRCIHAGKDQVFTDMDAAILETQCRSK